MDKINYVKMLAQRLTYMLEYNEKLKEQKTDLDKKYKYRQLTEKEKEVYFSNAYTGSAIERVRKELNTTLIEINKEWGY